MTDICILVLFRIRVTIGPPRLAALSGTSGTMCSLADRCLLRALFVFKQVIRNKVGDDPELVDVLYSHKDRQVAV